MNTKALLTTIVLTFGTLTSNAAVRTHSKTIAVETPENLPILAQNSPAAMYLHDTNDGSTVLYVEAADGRTLTALDVTDPADIQRIAQTNIPAPAAFDFFQDVGQQAVLIRYRDGSGVALLSFKHYKKPTLITEDAIGRNDVSEPLGATGFLLTSLREEHQSATRQFLDPRNFKVVDTNNPVNPVLLATITGVEQRLSKGDTGTLFFLNNEGIVVVRRLRVEQEHQNELDMEHSN